MRKFFYLAVTGIAVAGLTLAVPAESRADHRSRRILSVGIGDGGFYFDYSRGGWHGYPNWADRYYTPGIYAPIAPGDGFVPHRPVIVQPMEYQWSPFHGWHTHGQILVPHRGHYHAHPY